MKRNANWIWRCLLDCVARDLAEGGIALVYIETAVTLVAPPLCVKNNERKCFTGANPSGNVQYDTGNSVRTSCPLGSCTRVSLRGLRLVHFACPFHRYRRAIRPHRAEYLWRTRAEGIHYRDNGQWRRHC